MKRKRLFTDLLPSKKTKIQTTPIQNAQSNQVVPKIDPIIEFQSTTTPQKNNGSISNKMHSNSIKTNNMNDPINQLLHEISPTPPNDPLFDDFQEISANLIFPRNNGYSLFEKIEKIEKTKKQPQTPTKLNTNNMNNNVDSQNQQTNIKANQQQTHQQTHQQTQQQTPQKTNSNSNSTSPQQQQQQQQQQTIAGTRVTFKAKSKSAVDIRKKVEEIEEFPESNKNQSHLLRDRIILQRTTLPLTLNANNDQMDQYFKQQNQQNQQNQLFAKNQHQQQQQQSDSNLNYNHFPTTTSTSSKSSSTISATASNPSSTKGISSKTPSNNNNSISNKELSPMKKQASSIVVNHLSPNKLFSISENEVRLEKAQTERMIVNKVNQKLDGISVEIDLSGQSGTSYQVLISTNPSCTCADFQKHKKKHLCKHILFAMLSVFQFSPEDPLLMRIEGWTDLEVKAIILPKLQMYNNNNNNTNNNTNTTNVNNVIPQSQNVQSLIQPRPEEQDSLEELK